MIVIISKSTGEENRSKKVIGTVCQSPTGIGCQFGVLGYEPITLHHSVASLIKHQTWCALIANHKVLDF